MPAARVNPRLMQFIAVVHCVVRKALRSVIEARDPLQIRELVVIENGRHMIRKFRLRKTLGEKISRIFSTRNMLRNIISLSVTRSSTA